MKDKLLIGLCVVVALIVVAWLWHINAECSARGGTYVRMLWSWGWKCMHVEEIE